MCAQLYLSGCTCCISPFESPLNRMLSLVADLATNVKCTVVSNVYVHFWSFKTETICSATGAFLVLNIPYTSLLFFVHEPGDSCSC